ncbi:succinylglutamate desuccinylase/aspartoacylase family protein [Pseudomonadota bacterium]
MKAEDLYICGHTVSAGSRTVVTLPIPQLYTRTPMEMPVHIIRGRTEGPRIFVCAAMHGDELNGIEIIRRLLKRRALKRLSRGTLIAVPMVNVYGVIERSRYLPDRRDLNRCFPGSQQGSLASRVANAFMTEIVANSTHGIDLHTGAIHRDNMPQVRADLDDETTLNMARAFGVPVLLNSRFRDGSLRAAAQNHGVPILVYEAGEALRFDEHGIRAGVRGIENIMRHLGMLPPGRGTRIPNEPFVARSSHWIRASHSGVLRIKVRSGHGVTKGDALGLITDPFGGEESTVLADTDGIVIGHTHLPLVNEGDAVVHLACFEDVDEVIGQVEQFQTY